MNSDKANELNTYNEGLMVSIAYMYNDLRFVGYKSHENFSLKFTVLVHMALQIENTHALTGRFSMISWTRLKNRLRLKSFSIFFLQSYRIKKILILMISPELH